MARSTTVGLVACVWTLVGCRPPQHAANERCIFADDCQPGLICAGGYCRSVCRSASDCMNMWRCAPAPVEGQRICVPPDSPTFCIYHSDCIEPGCDTDAGCVPRQFCAANNVCLPPCNQNADCQAYHVALECVNHVCLYPTERDGGSSR